MIWQTIMKKYSMLVLGILMMGIFLTSPYGKKMIAQYRSNFIPSDCRALVDRTSKKLKSQYPEWTFECEEEVFLVTAPFKNQKLKPENIKSAMYKDLANKLVLLAKFSNEETLERIDVIRFKLKGEPLQILAQTNGEELTKFQTLKEQKNIIQHLQKTVKVKEMTE